MLGALVPIDAPYEVISPGASAVQPASGGALSGGDAKQMSPMESMKAIFEDIRDGIENIAGMVQTLVLGQQPTVGEKIAASDTDTGVTDVPEEKKGMLDSLRDSVGEDEFGKLKKALFVGIVASLFMFGEQIKPVVAGFLKALKMVIDFIGPKGALFLAIVGISRLAFPKTFALVLKTAGTAIKLVAAGFTSLFSFITGTLVPFVAAFAVPIAIIAGVVAGVIAVIYSIKKGIEAFKTSLEEGDSMIDAIIAGVSTALATLITLPATLFKNLLSYVAGLFGFDGIKAKLDDISFVEFFTNAFKMLFTGIKDFITGIFSIDFKGILGKGLDILGAIMTRIKAIAAAGFAAVKAAFPGGESPGEAFSRVYQERITKAEESEPKVEEGGEVLQTIEAEKEDTPDLQSDVEKLVEATAEKTHEEGDKKSKSKRDEYEALKAQGYSKSDARLILMFETNKTKGFPAYEEASMNTLGYNFQSHDMTAAEKLAWMKDKTLVDDEGNAVKMQDGDYNVVPSGTPGEFMSAGAGNEQLNEAVAQNKQAKDDSAGATGNIVVNNNNVDNSSQSQTNNSTKLSTDHSDPTANALKEVAGF